MSTVPGAVHLRLGGVYETRGDLKSPALEWPQMSVDRLSSTHSKDEHDGPHRPYLPDGDL